MVFFILYLVLERFGFSFSFIELINLKNPFFSVIVNGEMHGFFKNSRGLRQGDPLSPSPFIIADEVLSRGLSRLFSHNLVGYYRHGRGQIPITHLLFADDTLIFLNVSKKKSGKSL